jgi:alpha-beta hydrolase superfamily lysophospholipase
MNEITGTFDGIGGCKLFYKGWMPEGTAKAVMAIVHGAGEHIERYHNLVNILVAAGFALVGYDQRGHGRSEGQRGHIDSWDQYRGDLGIFLKLAVSLVPETPLFLYGHSMGSLVVLDYIMRTPEGLRGAIISGIALDPKDAAPPLLVLIAKGLSGILPKFSMKTPLPGSALSRDPEVAKAYDEDPLVFRERTPRWATENLKTIAWIKDHPEKITLPVFFVHGELDPLLSAEGAQQFYERISYPDKAIKIYPDGLHEPHNDLDHDQVAADLEKWLSEHI